MKNPNKLTGAQRLQTSDLPTDVVKALHTECGLLLLGADGVVYTGSYRLSDLIGSPRGGDRTRRQYAKLAGLKSADVIAACRAERQRVAKIYAARNLSRAKGLLERHGYRVTKTKTKGA